jgi:hypothetical protein
VGVVFGSPCVSALFIFLVVIVFMCNFQQLSVPNIYHLGFVCKFGGEGRGRLGKKGTSKWKKYRKMGEECFGGLTFLHLIIFF